MPHHRSSRSVSSLRLAGALFVAGAVLLAGAVLVAEPAPGSAPPRGPRLSVRLQLSQTHVYVGDRVKATLQVTYSPGPFRWRHLVIKWGDGSASDVLVSTRVHPTHTYRRAGRYDATFSVSAVIGLVASTSQRVTVTAKPTPSPTPSHTSSSPDSTAVTTCGIHLCAGAVPWTMYGATFYNPGLTPYRSGIKDPAGTVALAKQANLNTLRVTNFLSSTGDPTTAPYDETRWRRVDAMIAAASAAGLYVDLGLADFRNMMWNSCVNPYKASWSGFETWVANRVNTVTGVVYKKDPTIALVSIAGEPKPVGAHGFTASTTGKACTISYTSKELTDFYAATTNAWASTGASVLVNSGGLGYLNESGSGIDWQAIFALPHNAVCDVKTYGGMLAWAPVAATYCHGMGRPIVDEEYGWQQSIDDLTRAALYADTAAKLRASGFAGSAFWNLGYEVATTSYEVGPDTPRVLAAVRANAPS